MRIINKNTLKKRNRFGSIMARLRGKNRFKGLLSIRAQTLFFAAIFMTFASIGLLVSRGFSVGRSGQTFVLIVYYNLVATGWAWCFSKDMRLLFVVIPLSIFVPRFIGPGYISLDDVVVIALIVASFTLFMIFTTLEWPRSLRLQTEIGLARELHSR